MSIQEEIRSALAGSQLANVEIAKKIGINPVNLSHFKSGRMNLSVEKLEALAEAIGLEIKLKKKPR